MTTSKNVQEIKDERLSGDYEPRKYPFRRSAATTANLLVIGGSVFSLLWLLDVFLTAQ